MVPGSVGDWIQFSLIGGAFTGAWVLLGRAVGREEHAPAEVPTVTAHARASADRQARRSA